MCKTQTSFEEAPFKNNTIYSNATKLHLYIKDDFFRFHDRQWKPFLTSNINGSKVWEIKENIPLAKAKFWLLS